MMATLFYLYAAMVTAGALGVVFSTNIIRTAIQLLFTLLGIAGLYFLLHAEFLAAMQLVVYVGGTLVLMIFGVMLTARSSMYVYNASKFEKIMSSIIGAVILATLVIAFKQAKFPNNPQPTAEYPMDKLGQALLGDYLVPFELTSLLLLAVMIGAAFLAKHRVDRKGMP